MVLVEIIEQDYPIILDLRYASSHNFTQQIIYSRPLCFLHSYALPFFEKALELAAQQNLKIKIFDAFRPLSAQEKLWKNCPNPRYVANPEQGSCHTRGVAIDLTLVNNQGQELQMGTEFDDFSELSHHGAKVTPDENFNRYLLLGIMISAGWDFHACEWWHYQLPSAEGFPLLETEFL